MAINRRSLLKHGSIVAGAALAGCTGGPNGSDGDGGDSGDGSDGGDGGDAGDGGNGAESSDEVNVYGVLDSDAFVDTVAEETGIQVNSTVLLGGESTSRFLRENEANEHIADVLWGEAGEWPTLAEQDLIADPGVDNLDAVHSDEYLNSMTELMGSEEAAAKIVPLTYQSSCFTYNTDEVSDPPETYEDFLRDEFEGEIIAARFNLITIYHALEQQRGREFADDFMQELDSLNPNYVAKAPQAVVQDIAEGRGLVTMFPYAGHTTLARDDGAPVDFNFGPFIWRFNTAAIKVSTAPNPDAASEFLDYCASEEGQQELSQFDAGLGVFHENVPHGNSEIGDAVQDLDHVSVSLATSRRQELTSRLQDLGIDV